MNLAIRTSRKLYAKSGDLLLIELDKPKKRITVSIEDHVDKGLLVSADITKDQAQEIIDFLTLAIK